MDADEFEAWRKATDDAQEQTSKLVQMAADSTLKLANELAHLRIQIGNLTVDVKRLQRKHKQKEKR